MAAKREESAAAQGHREHHRWCWEEAVVGIRDGRSRRWPHCGRPVGAGAVDGDRSYRHLRCERLVGAGPVVGGRWCRQPCCERPVEAGA